MKNINKKSGITLSKTGPVRRRAGARAQNASRGRMNSALSILTRCFLKFGSDADKNIDIITRAAGKIMGSACVVYNRLEGDSLHTVSDWHAPSDMPRRDKAKGHICFDVITGAKDGVFIARDLGGSAYADSDPNVKKYDLKTYIGYPVKVAGKAIGSLCAVFKTGTEAAPDRINTLSILARALGVEEQRKEMENNLRESEDTLRKIFDTAMDAIFIKDVNSVYIKMNSFCAGLFGLTPDQMEGKSDFDVLPKELAQKLKNQDRLVIKNGGTLMSDNEIRTAKGEIRTFNSVKTPLYDSTGRTTGLLCISRDVTELKKLQNRLAERRAVEAVTLVAGPAAHDFNNILAAITGYATLIMETLKPGNPAKPEIEQILNAVNRAAAITDRLQNYGSGTQKN